MNRAGARCWLLLAHRPSITLKILRSILAATCESCATLVTAGTRLQLCSFTWARPARTRGDTHFCHLQKLVFQNVIRSAVLARARCVLRAQRAGGKSPLQMQPNRFKPELSCRKGQIILTSTTAARERAAAHSQQPCCQARTHPHAAALVLHLHPTQSRRQRPQRTSHKVPRYKHLQVVS